MQGTALFTLETVGPPVSAIGYTPRMAKRTKPIDLGNLISVPEAAELAGVDQRHMRRLVASGKVRGAKAGRNYLVDREAAAAFERERQPKKAD